MLAFDSKFAEDVVELVEPAPKLLGDILDRLRYGRIPSKRKWQNVTADLVFEVLSHFGAFIGYRRDRSTPAAYIASAPFSEVLVSGKPVPVSYRKVKW